MTDPPLLRSAIDWHLRLREADETAWLAFVAWLEADPAHQRAYDHVCATDALAGEALTGGKAAANDNATRPRRTWRTAALAGIAAVMVAGIFGLHSARDRQPSRYTIVVAAGEVRTVTIGPDASVRLDGGARLTLDRTNSRFASLEAGTGEFDIRHDPAHPFALALADHQLVDEGTLFRVDMDSQRIAVEVQQGGVTFDPMSAAVAIGPGQRLEFDRATGQGRLLKPAAEAAPRQPRPVTLPFNDVSFADVAASLARVTGEPVEVDKGLAGRRFTGVLKATGEAARDLPHFAEMTGTHSKHDEDHWVLAPARGDGR